MILISVLISLAIGGIFCYFLAKAVEKKQKEIDNVKWLSSLETADVMDNDTVVFDDGSVYTKGKNTGRFLKDGQIVDQKQDDDLQELVRRHRKEV